MTDPRRTDGRLLLGVGVLVALLVVLTVRIAVVQAQVVEVFWAVDPNNGLVVSPGQRSVPFAIAFEHPVEILLLVFLSAAIWVSVIITRLRSASRARQVRLTLMALPVIVPMLLTLGTALLARRWTQDTLEDIHRWTSDERLIGIGDCFGTLEPCSLLLAFDSVFTLAPVVILGVTACLLMPAMLEAWRAGARGQVGKLGKGWSRAAIVCFLLGAAALASTRAHRLDRAQVLAECTERDDPRNQHWTHAIPIDLHGTEVAHCMSPSAWVELHDLNLSRIHGVYANGDLVWISSYSPEQRLALDEVFTDDFDRPGDTTLVLYVDQRTPKSVLNDVLESARAIGIESVLLLGSSTISGELETVGPWQRRVQCGIELLHLD
jgi:hypothetical protein